MATPETPNSPDEKQKGEASVRGKRARTPFFEAVHALRYQRKVMIEEIERRTGRAFISYVAGAHASIDADDATGFVDLLHHLKPGADLTLLLHTGGGDIDAAEKIINLVRARVRDGLLHIVIPDRAKSAGTLMALGADFIVMSQGSELGPIDPQVTFNDGAGNSKRVSVQHYLDAYETHRAALDQNPNDWAAEIMMNKMDPITVALYDSYRNRARVIAETLLKRGMHKNSAKWSSAASELLDTKRWLSHAQMISWEDAKDSTLDLSVEYLEPDSEDWQAYWRLCCLQRLAVGNPEKLFESTSVSMVVGG